MSLCKVSLFLASVVSTLLFPLPCWGVMRPACCHRCASCAARWPALFRLSRPSHLLVTAISSRSAGAGSSRSTLTSRKQLPPRALRGRRKTPDPPVATPVAWAACGKSFGTSHSLRQTTQAGTAEVYVFVLIVLQCVFLLVVSPLLYNCFCSCSVLRMLFFGCSAGVRSSRLPHGCSLTRVFLCILFCWLCLCPPDLVPLLLSSSAGCSLLSCPQPDEHRVLAFGFRLACISGAPALLQKKACRHGVAAHRPCLCPHSMQHKR